MVGDAALLANPEEPASIAEKILRCLTEPDLRDELVRKGLERAKTFTWERCAAETLALFEEFGSRS